MCIHCLRTLSDLELDLFFLSAFSQTYLEFLFTMGPPMGRTCIHGLELGPRQVVSAVADTSTVGTVASHV